MERSEGRSEAVPDWIRRTNIKYVKVDFAGKTVKKILAPNLINIFDGKFASLLNGEKPSDSPDPSQFQF